MKKEKNEGFKLTAREKRQLDSLTRKAGIEVAVAEGNMESEEAEHAFMGSPFRTNSEYENNFPSRFKNKVPKGGAWILVKESPPTEFTVPPMSIWFAMPWTMTPDGIGCAPHRVKITTPCGDLGIMPCEYSLVQKVTAYMGREKEGIFIRQMSGNPVVDTDSLFYLMSRGIRRQEATMLLIEQIKDPTFLWFEIAPQYAEFFGRKWPSEARCPFATPREKWHEQKLTA